MKNNTTTLDKLKLKKTAVVIGFLDEVIAEKLMEMSCLPKSKIKMVRKAPLGDPIVVEINNHLLSMRKAEAKAVQIEL